MGEGERVVIVESGRSWEVRGYWGQVYTCVCVCVCVCVSARAGMHIWCGCLYVCVLKGALGGGGCVWNC